MKFTSVRSHIMQRYLIIDLLCSTINIYFHTYEYKFTLRYIYAFNYIHKVMRNVNVRHIEIKIIFLILTVLE